MKTFKGCFNTPNWNKNTVATFTNRHFKGWDSFHSSLGGLVGVCDIGVCCNFLGKPIKTKPFMDRSSISPMDPLWEMDEISIRLEPERLGGS